MNRLACLVFAVIPAVVSAEPLTSFSQAKRILENEIYADNPVTFYCGCSYSEAPTPCKKNRTRLTPDASSCGLAPRKQPNRSGRIEWEHVVPAWEFGHQMQCWQDGGRKACKKDPTFRAMEADLYNLVPAVGELNGDRTNYRYGMIAGEPRAYGQCDFEVDFKARVAEPAEHDRGDIARTYFYMADQYGLKIGRKQRQLFEAWARQDPIDKWEQERARRIEMIQGTKNRFVADQQLGTILGPN
ncbi:endonuclease [Marinobacterium nitratireducens]|uniref:Endonuclease n=1 Tax=Marinobacterium nitratireducens TaxID=518897 RepID=A0A918DRY3_9GAMM|nr:endonuclease [Marinobacterium nitratireducens]GGO80010.1 endonuclease [Marinobacterium nitratireducens]